MKKKSLFEKLPVIYRTEDAQQNPPNQMRDFVGTLDELFSNLRDDIEGLYHNFFIDTCEPWVIPYLGDLVGATPLVGDQRTLRADVSETIAIRKRKGSVESLARLCRALTGWPCKVVQLRENLAWFQHLNHFRPDRGGLFPREGRGGTLLLRDPSRIADLGTPYERAARTVELRPRAQDQMSVNLPNVALYLWRNRLFQIRRARPGWIDIFRIPNSTKAMIRIAIHPLANESQLRSQLLFSSTGPLRRDQLSQDVDVNSENPDLALNIHLNKLSMRRSWQVVAGDLCRWGHLNSALLQNNQIYVDPLLGRVAMVVDLSEAQNFAADIELSYWIGAVGDVGALPYSQQRPPSQWEQASKHPLFVRQENGENDLQQKILFAATSSEPQVIEIMDSGTYVLDARSGAFSLKSSLLIRAAVDRRPVILLKSPMGFRPVQILSDGSDGTDNQEELDLRNSELNLRWEGILFGKHKDFNGSAFITALSINSIQFYHCVLDPGGFLKPNGGRGAALLSFDLPHNYGLANQEEYLAIKQVPKIILMRSISGGFRGGGAYSLDAIDSIVDGVDHAAIDSPANEISSYDRIIPRGPSFNINGGTLLGDCFVQSIFGMGGVFTDSLAVWDTQSGCLAFSTFYNEGSRLPRVHACFRREDARTLRFTSLTFDSPNYGQISRSSAKEILEQGPPREGSFGDQMGAFGYLFETQRWKNLEIRLREYSPVGTVIMIVPVVDQR